jgi:tRNA(Ile)-lysidine synthase
MQVLVSPGTYVLAVSGGVDSMVLLDVLAKRPGVKLIVAHFDHGIREDSHLDRHLVQDVAKRNKLPFVYHRANLGMNASEAKARQERYKFLKGVQKASGAKAIITAHHQDDALETAVHNLLRGTRRRGLSSLRSTDGFIRPLLSYPKERLIDYANNHQLLWREDSTNQDTRYKRNYIRHRLLAPLTAAQRQQFRILIEEITKLNDHIDSELVNLLHVQPTVNQIDRNWFVLLPHAVAKEVLHHWLTRHGVKDVSNKRIEKLVINLKTGKAGKSFDADKKTKIHLTNKTISIKKTTG